MSINAMRIVWERYACGGSKMLVMLALADWCDDDGRSLYPSMTAIAKKCRLSKSQAQRIVRSFVDKKILEVVANGAGGKPGETLHDWLHLERLTGRTDATGSADATGRMDAAYGSHGCGGTGRMGATQSTIYPSLTTNGSGELDEQAAPLIPDDDSSSARQVPVDDSLTARRTLATQHTTSTPIHASNGVEVPSSRRLPSCPFQAIVDAYHEAMPNNPRVKVLNAERKRAIAARWNEASRLACKPFDGGYHSQADGLAKWREFFRVCAGSPFLTGHAPPQPGRPPFIARIDFLLSPSGFANTLENKYHRSSE